MTVGGASRGGDAERWPLPFKRREGTTWSHEWWAVAGQGPAAALHLLAPPPAPGLHGTPQSRSARLGGQTQLLSKMGTGGVAGRSLRPDPRPTHHPESWVPCPQLFPQRGKVSARRWPSTGTCGQVSRGLTRPGTLARRSPPESLGPGFPQWTENQTLSGCRVPPGPSPSQDAFLPGSSIPGLPDLTPIPQAARAQGIFNKN